MNVQRRKHAFRPTLETDTLEERVVLSTLTAGSVAAARALRSERVAAAAEVRLQRRETRLEHQAEMRVNRQITQAFNQFSQSYNVTQRQYLRAIRTGNVNALATFQAARANGLNQLASRLGTIYARLPQGTGTPPTVDAILGAANSGTLGTIGTGTTGTGTIGTGTIGTGGLTGNVGLGPGTGNAAQSLIVALGSFDNQNLNGNGLLQASRSTINTALQSALGSVGTFMATAGPITSVSGSNLGGFNNPTGFGSTSGNITNTGFGGSGFGGTTGLVGTIGGNGLGGSTVGGTTGLVGTIGGNGLGGSTVGGTTGLVGTIGGTSGTGINTGIINGGTFTSTGINTVPGFTTGTGFFSPGFDNPTGFEPVSGSRTSPGDVPTTTNINAGLFNPFNSAGNFSLTGSQFVGTGLLGSAIGVNITNTGINTGTNTGTSTGTNTGTNTGNNTGNNMD